MDKEFCNELNELLVTTFRAIRLIEETMTTDLSGGSISISELHILEAIGMADRDPALRAKGRTITEIAQSMGISLPSVTVAVKKLEKKGFVTKQKSPHDGRRIYVHLTELGRRADTSHRYFHRRMVHAVAKSMPEADRRALIDGLRVLNAFFQDKAEHPVEGHNLDELTAMAVKYGLPSDKREEPDE